jgi:Tfp pilus assembly protein PilF
MLLTAMVAGCAPGKSAKTSLNGETPIVPVAPTVTRLVDGRTGFVILEPCDLSAPWRESFDKAVIRLEGQDYPGAIALLEEVIQQSPDVTAPYINLGKAYRHNDQFDLAEKSLHKALSLVANHPVASHEYGLLLRHSGRFDEARAVYEAALEEFPEYEPIRLNLGILCELYLNDLACANEQYTRYSEANPDAQEVTVWLADLALRSAGR